MLKSTRAMLMLAASMIIFGTIGPVRTALPVSSGFLAFFRGVTGMLILLLPALRERKNATTPAGAKPMLLLALTGALMGVNWILLFEAYRFTTVSRATLSYYMAPVIVIALSPIVLREKIGLKQAFCVAAAVIGMVPVSGVLYGARGANDLKGVLLGLGAATLYASVVLLNKALTTVPVMQKTAVQLGAAGIAVLPYVFLTNGFPAPAALELKTVLLLLAAGAVHTGLAYLLYFGAIPHVTAQTAAVFSYIDPVTAILLSTLLLHEKADIFTGIGAVLILGATLVNAVDFKNLKKNKKSA